ncbi:L-lactate dehydrogenase [Novosphingobium sp.]|uniref:L-lactate dehydrogenase n=1 Tax=Novosphingobium sp. TaxID=1874826 RepID=UPI001ED287D3|nr:L-lactate dehydrogenase [Novosphingobium sp.]MBK9011209.1 L-lactate dehydrogenase [Novosphingobium sp.]
MGQSLNLLPASFADFRREAEKRLPRFLFDYIDGGAGAEVTLRRNTADWEEVSLNQKVLVDASKMDCSVDLFGEKLAMPLILAPVGMGGMTARRGEVQAKRAADAAGIPFCLSTVGICTLEEVGAVSDRPAWFQLYMLKDRGIVQEILARAWDNGVRTLAFTIDLAVLGTRYRDIRNGMAGGLGPWGRFRSGALDYALHPRWAWDVGLKGAPHGFGNIAMYVKQSKNPRDYLHWTGTQFDSSVTWTDIEWLRGVWQGNLVLKGVLDVADARAAVAVGADGMIVSNHGGRQLDGAASTASMLPRIADAVGSETTLLVDGGIRCGQDLVKALALGARAALVGRPWVMALAAGGEAALTRMLGLYKQDMRTALGLTGIPNARDVGRAALLEG